MGEETTISVVDPGGERRRDGEVYLLVFDDTGSWKYPLPDDGEVVIGRSQDAQLRLHERSVSRRHAQLDIRSGQVKIADLGSHNSVRVNGQLVRKEASLQSHDVVSLGKATLVFHSTSTSPPEAILTFDQLAARGDAWIRRNRRLALVLVAFDSPPSRPELLIGRAGQRGAAGWASPCELVALLPGAGSDEGVTIADRLVDALGSSVPVHASLARFPADGATVLDLLARARSARSQVDRVTGGTVRRLRAGDRTVVVADPAMIRLQILLERLAASDVPVLIGGETGVGKEVAARLVHHQSRRAGRPFVALNCASLPESLAESELFGHDKGAFTGAAAAKPGLFESAAGGTVFLDEIGELSPALQAKLLRVVETKRSMRLGELRERDIDMRILAATNRDLEADVRAGRFRADLYFRVSVGSVWIPPLRDRPRELALLAQEFLAETCARAKRDALILSPATYELFAAYGWPGNVRELRNVIEFVVASVPGPVVQPLDLPDRVRAGMPADRRPGHLDDEIRELERRRMTEALATCAGNQSRAADLIGMPRRTFVAKLKQYRLR